MSSLIAVGGPREFAKAAAPLQHPVSDESFTSSLRSQRKGELAWQRRGALAGLPSAGLAALRAGTRGAQEVEACLFSATVWPPLSYKCAVSYSLSFLQPGSTMLID